MGKFYHCVKTIRSFILNLSLFLFRFFCSQWRVFDPAGPSGYLANCTTSIFRKMKPEERLRGGGQSLISDEETDTGSSAGTSSNSEFLDPDVRSEGNLSLFQMSKLNLHFFSP